MASLSFRVRVRRTDAQGYAPMVLRLIHDRTVRRISLDVRVLPTHWNSKRERVRGRHPEAARINQYLTRTMHTAQSAITRERVGRGVPDGAEGATRLRRAVSRALSGQHDGAARAGDEQPTDFLAYAQEQIEAYEQRGQAATARRYRADISKLIQWWEQAGSPSAGSPSRASDTLASDTLASDTLTFDGLTVVRLEQFRTWMYDDLDNVGSTVGKTLKTVRVFVNKARRAGLMNHYPFEHITIDSSKSTKEKLTPQQMRQLQERLWDGTERRGSLRWRTLAYFVFSYYAGGMRFSDVMTLQRKHLRGGRIAWRMQKTGDDVPGVPIMPEAMRILEAFAEHPVDDEWIRADPDAWVFPIAARQGITPESSPKAHEQARSTMNALANKYLKKVQRDAGISVSLSFHLARHSAAWQMYRTIGDIYKVSRLLGHSSVQQTERYLEGFADDSLDDAFRGAF